MGSPGQPQQRKVGVVRPCKVGPVAALAFLALLLLPLYLFVLSPRASPAITRDEVEGMTYTRHTAGPHGLLRTRAKVEDNAAIQERRERERRKRELELVAVLAREIQVVKTVGPDDDGEDDVIPRGLRPGRTLGEGRAYITVVPGDAGGGALLENALDFATRLNSSSSGATLVLLVRDRESSLDDAEKARVESAGNVRLVDVPYVYEQIFLNDSVPSDFGGLKRKIYRYANFEAAFEGYLRPMMWLLWEYETLIYVDPDTVYHGPVDDLFDLCDSATLCAPELYQDECAPRGSGGPDPPANKTQQDLFNPRLMVLKPQAGTASRFWDILSSARKSKYGAVDHDLGVLFAGLSDSWAPLPPCYSDLLALGSVAEEEEGEEGGRDVTIAARVKGMKSIKVFGKSVKILQGASGKEALGNLLITSKINALYAQLHGFGYSSFEGRLLNESRYTSHWDRYKLARDELAGGWDYVVWMDSDVMVREIDWDLRQLISAAGGGVDILISADWEFRPKVRPFPPVNTGVMVLRNSNWTLDFLDGFLSLENAYCRKCAKKYCSRIKFHDQGCLEEYIMTGAREIRDHMQVLPVGTLQRKINDDFKIGAPMMPRYNSNYSFAVHAAGLPKKREVMEKNAKAILKRLGAEDPGRRRDEKERPGGLGYALS
mmetsp:Transcript_7111/g.20739  ORF Transcript_7111/g.20739 Transcript_7111/m.20739 type:complete len:659 (-) Transcript_7111:206-2182(-)